MITTTRQPYSKLPVCHRAGLFLLLCFLTIASVPRFLSLEAHWASDEARWLRRSAAFIFAVKQGEFSETRLAYHPGVTTMWIAGLRTFFAEPHVDVENLALARFFLGIGVSAGIGIACLLLYKFFGQWVALASFACLAYSPLFLAQTRRVHTDSLATIFILLTVLLFLCYCQNQQYRRYLILSGVAFGLAVLSKSYALILLLWIPICLFLFRSRKKQRGRFWTHLAEILCFLNCTALTGLALWPVFWTPTFGILGLCLFGTIAVLSKELKTGTISVKSLSFWAASVVFITVCIRALQTIWIVLDKVNRAVTTPHEVEHFFLGKVVNDPGWLFYPFVLTIKSTPLMLPLALVGCFLIWKRRKYTEETSGQFQMALALVTSVVLFTGCLSATSKKFSRYLLPAFPMLEILSAIGFIESLRWGTAQLNSYFTEKEAVALKNTFIAVACLSFLLIQIQPIVTLHPYYGTYYNPCWKVADITKVITVGDASGLDIAAKYLNDKPDPRKRSVQVSPLLPNLCVATSKDTHTGQIEKQDTPQITKSSISEIHR